MNNNKIPNSNSNNFLLFTKLQRNEFFKYIDRGTDTTMIFKHILPSFNFDFSYHLESGR